MAGVGGMAQQGGGNIKEKGYKKSPARGFHECTSMDNNWFYNDGQIIS